MTTPAPNRRSYHLTLTRFFIGLLAVQVFLLLSERFQWFPFNAHKGWTVLIAVGVVGVAVLVMLLWGLACLVLRRRFQFGVRSLLVLLVALSVPMGWFAMQLQKARRQREAVERIVGMGGVVAYDYEIDKNFQRKSGAGPTTPTWLRSLFGDVFFCQVVQVNLVNWEFGDNDARYLKELTALRHLSVDGTQITDDGLARLAGLTQLRWLSLSGAQITGDGLAHLKEMNRLEMLTLNDAQICDDGLAHLRGMPKIAWLSLDSTPITDEGLAHLQGIAGLKMLWLGNTRVTDEGISQLQQALPNCHVDTSPIRH
jgi:hypothetical protein